MNEQIIKFIKKYIENDKNQSAIMISGAWGTGKSFFIKNELIPTLEEDKKIKVINISLYGIESISELSENIFIECLFLENSSKLPYLAPIFKSIGSSINNYIGSKFGINFYFQREDKQKILDVLDFKNRVLIFEDIERSKINITDLLGYVNNLTEQHNYKVILVANEDEFLKYEINNQPIKDIKKYNKDKENEMLQTCFSGKNTTSSNETEKELTYSSLEYLKVKEKTVSDTINFKSNFHDTIESILKSFDNKVLNGFCNTDNVKEIYDLLSENNAVNYRSLIFACQKAIDIFDLLKNKNLPDDFKKSIFCGIIIFSKKLKEKNLEIQVPWTGDRYISTELGNSSYPLYRFCYEYILHQTFDEKINIEEFQKSYTNLKLIAPSNFQTDPDFEKIINYLYYTDEEVLAALENLKTRLIENDTISLNAYANIVINLIILKDILNFDIEEYIKALENNLRGQQITPHAKLLFPHYKNMFNEEQEKEYIAITNRLKKSFCEITSLLKFNYNADNLGKFHEQIKSMREIFINNMSFINNLNISKFSEMLSTCTSKQINEIDTLFCSVYDLGNVSEVFHGDKEGLQELLENMKKIDTNNFDKIGKFQLNLFIGSIAHIIEKL